MLGGGRFLNHGCREVNTSPVGFETDLEYIKNVRPRRSLAEN